MAIPDVVEKWAGKVNAVTLGATAAQGGTRANTVTVGGGTTLPFLAFEGTAGNGPALAVEIWDSGTEAWPEQLRAAYADVIDSPVAWAKKVVALGADLVCLRLVGAHPDLGNRPVEQCVQVVKDVLAAVGVPLIVWGCGSEEVDNKLLPAVSAAAKGENLLIGAATERNYRTLVAVCLADKHKLIAESPCDVNIAKQVNILASDVGFPLEDLVMFPTTGALGYGMEYVYSIQERARLAALAGDKLLAQPFICDVGYEAWRAKEAKAPPFDTVTDANRPQWGIMWEAATAVDLLQAAAEIIVLRHPDALAAVRKALARMAPAAR